MKVSRHFFFVFLTRKLSAVLFRGGDIKRHLGRGWGEGGALSRLFHLSCRFPYEILELKRRLIKSVAGIYNPPDGGEPPPTAKKARIERKSEFSARS